MSVLIVRSEAIVKSDETTKFRLFRTNKLALIGTY